jgi:tryptophan synthase beta chain
MFATEGVLPSAEAAYAVHDACVQAGEPRNAGRSIVFCVSDHGYYDSDAYLAYLEGDLHGRRPSEEEIRALTDGLAAVSETSANHPGGASCSTSR